MKTIEEELRQAVRDSGRTINSIAVAAGISSPRLYQFMKGGGMSNANLGKLARALGLDLVAPKLRQRTRRRKANE